MIKILPIFYQIKVKMASFTARLGKLCCHNPNSTLTQLKSWVWHENDFRPPPPPPPTTTTTNSMSLISQLFLAQFKPNFKGRFVGSTTTITTTIWRITPTTPTTQTQCQQYISCYWPDFNQTLKAGLWDQKQPYKQQQLLQQQQQQ